MDRSDRRDLYNGYGNTLTRAFELAAIPLVFAAPGWFLDRWLGTGPFLAFLTGAFGLAGVCARTYFEYSARMDALQSELPSSARARETAPAANTEVAA